MPLVRSIPLFAALSLAACASNPAAAQPPAAPPSAPVLSPVKAPDVPDAPIDAATRARVIDSAMKNLAKYYVDPDVAAKIEASVRAHQARGDYDRVTSSLAFAKLLSSHFFETAHDAHLSIKYTPRLLPADPAPDAKPDPTAAAAADAAEKESMRRANCGFVRVERLAGNVGYVKFDRFDGPWECGDVVAAAMSFVGGTDALIFDVRDNQGGYPEMVTLVASYLFDGWPAQLSSIYWRDDGQASGNTVQAWTSSYVQGKRFGKEKPVYVLTSAKTVSGAEAFAYDLQALKRATIIGETTVGGANPGNVHRVSDHFHMQIAQGRAVNPVTKTNWEGTGVKPDVAVKAEAALATAKVMALEGIAGKAGDAEWKGEVETAIKEAKGEVERAKTGR